MSCPHSLRTCPSCEVAEKIVAEQEAEERARKDAVEWLKPLLCGCDPNGELCHEHQPAPSFAYDRKPRGYPDGVCLEDVLAWQRLRR